MNNFPQGRHLSQLIADLIAAERMPPTVGDLVDHFRERGMAAVLGLLAFPIALPIPMPGISAVFGLPMLFIAAQIILRRPALWLPSSVRQRALDPARLQAAGRLAIKWIGAVERLLKPRLSGFFHPVLESIYGMVCAWLALILFLPIPLGNVLPSLSIFILAIALLERDGLAALFGLALSIISIVITAGVLGASLIGLWKLAQGAIHAS